MSAPDGPPKEISLELRIDLEIQPQPTDRTCGPTCLHAVYRYYGDDIPLRQVVEEVHTLETGGTLAVLLACHALRRGYQARIYTYNLQAFDPTWFGPKPVDIAERLRLQREFKSDPTLQTSTDAYLDFLALGGELRLEDLTPGLIRSFLTKGIPILAGLSSTYLYRACREYGPKDDDDDVRGHPAGHFVILSGYDREQRAVLIADPLSTNPLSPTNLYTVSIDRVIPAIMLGVLTYDANLLVLTKKRPKP